MGKTGINTGNSRGMLETEETGGKRVTEETEEETEGIGETGGG
jgi:hypothetical protein